MQQEGNFAAATEIHNKTITDVCCHCPLSLEERDYVCADSVSLVGRF